MGKGEAEEKRVIAKTRTKKRGFLYFLEETVWSSRIWQNRKFKRFISDAKPDVFFAFATNSYILDPLIKYIKRNTAAKIVLFIADDMRSSYEKRGFFRRRSLLKKFDRCIASADKLYGISDEMCEHYSAIYKKDVAFLCKGCDFSLPLHEKQNVPAKIVYAGNVLYGREETLAALTDALRGINERGAVAKLDIYTMTELEPETAAKLNVEGVSRVCGGLPYAELLKVINDADILLHVESFDSEAAEKVKYSFSTKITDCLQSGTAVVAIGPGGIASIEYLRKVDGAVVIDSVSDIKRVFEEILSDVPGLLENGKKIRDFAKANLSGIEINKRLRKEFEDLIDS